MLLAFQRYVSSIVVFFIIAKKNTDVKEKPAERIPKSNVSGKIPKAALKRRGQKPRRKAEEKSRTKLRENISAQGMVADTFHSAVKQNTDFTIIQTGICYSNSVRRVNSSGRS